MDRLSEIRARCERATPGPWEAQNNGYLWNGRGNVICHVADNQHYNADFIAYAREDIPYLLAEVERLNQQLNSAKIGWDTYKQYSAELTARAEKAKAERDKAAEFIRWVDDNFSHYMPQEYTDRLMTLERNHFKSPQEVSNEDTGMDPEETKDFMDRWEYAAELAGLCKEAGADRLRELAEADRDGRLVVLPRKVGDTVYADIDGTGSGFYDACIISEIKIMKDHAEPLFTALCYEKGDYQTYWASDFGKEVFLAPSDAKKKQKRPLARSAAEAALEAHHV